MMLHLYFHILNFNFFKYDHRNMIRSDIKQFKKINIYVCISYFTAASNCKFKFYNNNHQEKRLLIFLLFSDTSDFICISCI